MEKERGYRFWWFAPGLHTCLIFAHASFGISSVRPLCSHPARKNQGSHSPMPRRASASAVWFTRSEHAFGIFLTRCFLKSPDQSDLSLTALRHLRCLIELSETREKSTVYWIASMTYCCCFNHCALLGVGYWCSVGDCLLCVFVVCAFMVMFCCFVVDVL